MRPSGKLLILLIFFSLLSVSLGLVMDVKRESQQDEQLRLSRLASELGLSDLALSTEARYTRHPVASDSMVVSMDHPGGIDHFPSTLFWVPVSEL